MEVVTARLSIEVLVNCPHCEGLIDLMNERDTCNYNHNEEGAVISQACPDGHWIDEHSKFEIKGVTCSECYGEFNVKGIDW